MMVIHGDAREGKRTRFYNCWKNMKGRCNNRNRPDWEYYGGKGVLICERWNSYNNFKSDMFSSYLIHALTYGENNTTLDRVDRNGNYEPSNCRWATWPMQRRNSAKITSFIATRLLDGYQEIGFCQKDFALDYNLNRKSISNCLNEKFAQVVHSGWKFELLSTREDYTLILSQL